MTLNAAMAKPPRKKTAAQGANPGGGVIVIGLLWCLFSAATSMLAHPSMVGFFHFSQAFLQDFFTFV